VKFIRTGIFHILNNRGSDIAEIHKAVRQRGPGHDGIGRHQRGPRRKRLKCLEIVEFMPRAPVRIGDDVFWILEPNRSRTTSVRGRPGLLRIG